MITKIVTACDSSQSVASWLSVWTAQGNQFQS